MNRRRHFIFHSLPLYSTLKKRKNIVFGAEDICIFAMAKERRVLGLTGYFRFALFMERSDSTMFSQSIHWQLNDFCHILTSRRVTTVV